MINSKYILWFIEWINMKYGAPLVPKGWNLRYYYNPSFRELNYDLQQGDGLGSLDYEF